MMPLFLAFALCTTQVTARDISIWELLYYCFGAVAFGFIIGSHATHIYQTSKNDTQHNDVFRQRTELENLMKDQIKIRMTKDFNELPEVRRQTLKGEISPTSWNIISGSKV